MQFRDKKNNLIIITSDDSDVLAHHEGTEIGRIQFDHLDEGTVLYHMDVKADYHRAGIALQMMKEAVDIHGDSFGKPSFTATGGECYEYYSQEGSSFIHYCIKIGLLKDTEIQE